LYSWYEPKAIARSPRSSRELGSFETIDAKSSNLSIGNTGRCVHPDERDFGDEQPLRITTTKLRMMAAGLFIIGERSRAGNPTSGGER
jgi:hypothetical protein